MKVLLVGIFLLFVFVNFSEAKPRKRRQLSFAIPALSFLNRNNNNNNNSNFNNNIFAPKTTTRTVVRTVATVTQPAFRTCTAIAAAVLAIPCAGRRRRDMEEGKDASHIEATPVIMLQIGTRQISDPQEVEQFLEEHRPLPSVIGFAESDTNIKLVKDVPHDDTTTALYTSRDILEQSDDFVDDFSFLTTETPYARDFVENDAQVTTTPQTENDELDGVEKARINFGSVVTITSTIAVTSIATTYATGAMATLTVSYLGCSPNSFPVSGLACP